MRKPRVRFFCFHPWLQEQFTDTLRENRMVTVVDRGDCDIGLFDGGSPTAAKSLQAVLVALPTVRPLVALLAPDHAAWMRWLSHGVWGIIDFRHYRTELCPAIFQIASDRPWCSSDALPYWTTHRSVFVDHQLIGLTERERQVAGLLLDQSCCNKEIARALNISERTVKFHFTNIFRKLSVGSRDELRIAIGTSGTSLPGN